MLKLIIIFVLATIGLATNGAGCITPASQLFNSNVFKSNKVMMEIWKDVIGYEGLYQVSNLGRIKSLNRIIKHKNSKKRIRERILKPSDTGRGHLFVVLCRNGVKKQKLVHRLKAIAFIPNPENKRTVNHRDGIRSNNGYNADGDDNLEWATYSENHLHAYRELGRKAPMLGRIGINNPRSIPIEQLTMNNEYIASFVSAAEAARILTLYKSHISSVCRGDRNHTGGYKWRSIIEKHVQ